MRNSKPWAVAVVAFLLLILPSISAFAAKGKKTDATEVTAAMPNASTDDQSTPKSPEESAQSVVVQLSANAPDQSATLTKPAELVPPADPAAPAQTDTVAPVQTDTAAVKPSWTMPKLGSACNLAKAFLGTPYRWGGTTPAAFDCSGFVRYVYLKLGVKLPRTARDQYKVGSKVAMANLKAGDLVFFNMSKGYVSHVGMYLGDGKFIHASTPRTGVRIDNLDLPIFRKHLVGARRYAQTVA